MKVWGDIVKRCNEIDKNYAKKLKSARIKLGLTQTQLAEKLGISSSTIGMYEQGRRSPDFNMLLRLCGILKISIYDFFFENKALNISLILKDLIIYLKSNNDVLLNGNVLDKYKKNSIAYVLNLLINDKQ